MDKRVIYNHYKEEDAKKREQEIIRIVIKIIMQRINRG
jgi:hypothetical protein